MHSELQRFLIMMTLTRVIVWQTRREEDTVRFIADLYHQLARKTWDEHRSVGADHCFRHIEIHLHQFGGIARFAVGAGDDHRDGLADVAHFFNHQRHVALAEDIAGQRFLECRDGVIDRADRIGMMVDALIAAVQIVLAGQYRDHAGSIARGFGVDGENGGVRMRRTQERCIGLAFDADVVGVAAVACDEAPVFKARKRLTDHDWISFSAFPVCAIKNVCTVDASAAGVSCIG